ncbi:MAG: translocation/assembly module TamB domain-containing protein [Verrucomicrobiota bacterium]
MGDTVDNLPRRRSTKSRLLRWGLIGLGVTFLVIVVGCLWFNGPGFRWLTPKVVNHLGNTHGFSANLEVTGRLSRGIEIENLQLERLPGRADFPVDRLSIDRFVFNYDIVGLVTSASELAWLDEVILHGSDITVTFPEPEESPEPKAESDTPIGPPPGADGFTTLWNILSAKVDLKDIDVTIHQAENTTRVEGFTFSLNPAGDGEVRLDLLALPGQEPITDISLPLTHSPRRLALGYLAPLESISLQHLAVAEPEPGLFTIDGQIEAAGGMIQLGLDQNQQIYLRLNEGDQLDLGLIPVIANLDPAITGAITRCDLQFAGPFDSPGQWQIAGQVEAKDLSYDGYDLETISLQIQNERARLELSRNQFLADISAAVPLAEAETAEQLAKLPISLAGKIEVASIEGILSDFAIEIPATGSLALDLSGIRLVGGTEIAAGAASLIGQSLTYNGIPLEALAVQAAVAADSRLNVTGEAALDGQTRLNFSGNLSQSDYQYEGEAGVVVDTKSRFSEMLKTFVDELELGGRAALTWQGRGSLTEANHEGGAAVLLEAFQVANATPINGSIKLQYQDSDVIVPAIDLVAADTQIKGAAAWVDNTITIGNLTLSADEEIRVTVKGTVPFDPAIPFLEHPDPFNLDLTATKLRPHDLTRFFMSAPPITGQLDGQLSATGRFSELESQGSFRFVPRVEGINEETNVAFDYQFSGDANVPQTWETRADATLSGLIYRDVAIDDLIVDVDTFGDGPDSALSARIAFTQGDSSLDADARFDLGQAASLEDLSSIPLLANAYLQITSLESLLADFAPEVLARAPLGGGLTLKADGVEMDAGSFVAGAIDLSSENLLFHGQAFDSISIEADVVAPDQIEAVAAITLDDHAGINLEGGYHLKDQLYHGSLTTEIAPQSSSRLRAILAEVAGGSLLKLLPANSSLTWSGHGEVTAKDHKGDLDLSVGRLLLADGAEPIDLALRGSYTADSADIPEFRLSSRPLDLSAAIGWQENRLVVSDLVGTSGGRQFLNGRVSAPLDPAALSAETWFAQNESISVDLDIDQAPVGTLSRLALEKAPVLADLDLSLSMSGSPATPTLSGDISVSDLFVPQPGKPDLPAGRLDLKLNASDNRASVSGSYDHPDIDPLTVTAAMPFHPGSWATGQRSVAEESIEAAAKMDRSSLAFLRTQIPGIEAIEGIVALDARVSGTIAAPQISGDGVIDLDRLRFEDRNLPDISQLDTVVRFADNQVRLDRLYAIAAGGVLEASGQIDLDGEEPRLDFTITGREVLFTRTPDYNVRSNVDLRVAGPFSAAAITGELGITNSRFFKNIDLLPIGLPARETSAIPTVERTRGAGVAYTDLDLGVKIEPFANWTTDIRIRTVDPFLIRGNLARSALSADLRVTGPLSRPQPSGFLKIDEGELSLPFSSVDVEIGRVEFDERTGFNGDIEFKARAKADKYRINIFVYDSILSPKYVLTSVPSLPSEDIITLLATGTVRSDLTGDGVTTLAASKAATLFIKNLRKASAAADAEPTLLDELQERTELELGRTNPKTGTQTFGGKIRLWKQLFFVGDVVHVGSWLIVSSGSQ